VNALLIQTPSPPHTRSNKRLECREYFSPSRERLYDIPLKYMELRRFGTDARTLNMITEFAEIDYWDAVEKKAKAELREQERQERPIREKADYAAHVLQARMRQAHGQGNAAPGHVPEPPPLDISRVPKKGPKPAGARTKMTGPSPTAIVNEAHGWETTTGGYRAAAAHTPTPDWMVPPLPPLIRCRCGRETTSIGSCGCVYASRYRHSYCINCGGWGHFESVCPSSTYVRK